MSEVKFDIEISEREFQRFRELPFFVAIQAFKEFMESSTVYAHKRALISKRGIKRTWITPEQRAARKSKIKADEAAGKKPRKRKKLKPRGFTSQDGYVPVDTGNLRRNIKWKFQESPVSSGDLSDVFLSFGRIYNDEKYAALMEEKRGFFARAKSETNLELRRLFKKAVKRAKAKMQ